MIVEYAFSQDVINPDKISLAGFLHHQKNKISLGPNQLYVKILWLRANVDLIFISIDSLYFSREVANNLYRYVYSKFNITKDHIILNATHTHSAPNMDLEFFGNIDKGYLGKVEDKIKKGLRFCHDNFQKGFVEFKNLECKLKVFVSRRKMGRDIRSLFLKKRIIMLPNEKKPIDKNIHLIKLYDSNLKLDGIIYNFSCHPVFNTNYNISSDFIGAISSMLDGEICRFSMFLQGFAGDVRPNYTEIKTSIRNLINFSKLIFNKRVFSNYNQVHFDHFCNQIFSCIIQAKSSYKGLRKKMNDSYCYIRNSIYEDFLESKTSETRKSLSIKLVLISNNMFISIPAEVHSCYPKILHDMFPSLHIYPLGYADGMIGYLPSEKEIQEGGYEVQKSVKYYGWDSSISEISVRNFTTRLIKEIRKLLEHTGD